MNDIFSSRNITAILLGIAGLVVGYILLGQGPAENHLSWSVAPVVLVIVYCVVLPLAIIRKDKPAEKKK